jgi:integrase
MGRYFQLTFNRRGVMGKPNEQDGGKRQRAKANRKHFTESNVRTLPAKRKQYLVWDAGSKRSRDDTARGLAILVSPTGTKSYRCVYTYPGSAKPFWMHLGRVGEMPLEEARERCRKVRGKARKGEDPTDPSPHSDNFKVAVETYIKHEQMGKRHNKSAHATQTLMLNKCREWHARSVATIRYREIEGLLELIRDGDAEEGRKAAPYLANRLYAHLSDFFAWCVKRYDLKASPMAAMDKPWNGAKPRERDWFKKEAGDNAIQALWQAANKIGGTDGKYLKLMLLTGKRRTSLAQMRWEQIGPDWFWDAPKSEIKNKRLHPIPLPTLAQRVLHPRRSQGPVFADINPGELIKTVRTVSGINDFFWHGLRHLAETKTAELRDRNTNRPLILPHIRDLLFDHAPQRGSGKGFDHHDYLPEMREAMEVWADYVQGLVGQKGVRVLR